jgi:mannosyltransferase OCH1-like enzyme
MSYHSIFLFLFLILILLFLVLIFVFVSHKSLQEDFVTAVHKKKTLPSRYQQRVPFIIVTTHEATGCQDNLRALIKLNPEYHVYFFDRATRRAWLHDHFSQEVLDAYDTIIPGAYKADLFRYCFLFKKGGVYIDLNKKMLAPMRTFVHSCATMGLVLNSNHTADEPPKIINGFMYIVQGHSLMKEMIARCVRNIQKKKYGNSPLSVTGPYVFGAIFKELLGQSLYQLGTGVHYVRHEVIHVLLFKENSVIGDPVTGKDLISFMGPKDCLPSSAPVVQAYRVFWDERRIYKDPLR